MLKNIFWTGGFDSTFRLLQLIDDVEITEINIYYIALSIDNIKNSTVCRRSIEIELKTMQNILSVIETRKIKSFTIIGKSETLLHCNFMFNFSFMKYISKEEILLSDRTKVNYFDLFANGYMNRPVSQYTYISQILDDLDIEADICLEYNPDNPISFWSLLSNSIVGNKIIPNKPELDSFSKYNLPIINLTKEDMLEISITNDWVDIVELSWSCWYPDEGEACGRCFACKRRVV
jgi:hypothetical protein